MRKRLMPRGLKLRRGPSLRDRLLKRRKKRRGLQPRRLRLIGKQLRKLKLRD